MDLDKVFDSITLTLPDNLVFMYADDKVLYRVIQLRVSFSGGRDTVSDVGIYHAVGRRYYDDGESSLDEKPIHVPSVSVPKHVKDHFVKLALQRATEHRLGLLLLAAQRGLVPDEGPTQDAPA